MNKKINFSKIYLRAARAVSNGENKYSCNAIYGDFPPEIEDLIISLYRSVFCDGRVGGNLEWECIRNLDSDAERKRVRVLMLCLMSACWRDFV